MKKNILTIILSFTCITIFSQTKYAIKAGVNFANVTSKGETADAGILPSSITAFHFGGIVEIGLNSKYYFQPGLLISKKGYKIDYSASERDYSFSLKSKIDILYLEAPLNIIAKFDSAPGNFMLGGGPYIGYSLSGKNKGQLVVDGPGNAEDASIPTDQQFTFGDGEEEVPLIDYGINLLTGYEFQKGHFFGLGYSLGLKDLDNTGNSIKNSVISISFGFKIK